MAIHTEANVADGYLHLSCSGEFSSDTFLEVFEKGFTIAQDQDVVALLVDTRGIEGPPPSVVQRFDLAKELAERQRAYSPRIPVVVLGDEPFVSHDKFGETVAANRGATGKVFTDLGAAVTWIERFIEEQKVRQQSDRGDS